MTTPIQIRNEDVVRDIRELASLACKPITEVVAQAVRSELRRARRKVGLEAQRAAVRDVVRRFNEAAVAGQVLTDADLYDEDGLPR